MKLRIRGNSIRLRLSQTEVSQLGHGQSVGQTTEFSADSMLSCRVQPGENVTLISASFAGNHIQVHLPLSQVAHWANSELVSLQADQPISGGRSLSILVEKDFECLHSQAEGNTDTFPNPRLKG